MSDRRPKRRCVTAKAQRQQAPSAIHYVGYVEDDETPEMIMKKFEELERIQKAAEARRQQQQQQQGAGTSQAPGDARPATEQGAGGGPSAPGPGSSAVAESAAETLNRQPALPGPDQHASSSQPSHSGQPDVLAAPQSSGPQELPLPQHANPNHADQGLNADAIGSGHAPGASGMADGGGGVGMDAPGEPPLDEEVLLEVFRQTSILNLRSALADGGDGGGASRYDAYGVSYGMEDAFMAAAAADEDGGEAGSDVDEEEMQAFWSDDDYELGSSRRRRTGGGGGRAERSDGGAGGGPPREPKQPRVAGTGASRHAMAQVVTQYNRDTNALIRRRVAGGTGGGGGDGGGGGLVQLRVPPPPLPLSWGRTVRPYQPPEPYRPPDAYGQGAAATTPAADAAAGAADAASASRAFECGDLPSFPFDSALGGRPYLAVMVNAGWQPAGAAEGYERGGEAEVMARFRKLPIPRLVPRGFVFVWAHKGLLAAVCRQLAGWGYVYVENLTWVHITPGNAIAAQPGRHFKRSHSTLLIFRKEGEGRDIELRHQRNPDVVFDCIRTRADGGGWEVPSEVWTAIETLLPGGRGAFLELWAPRGVRRPGWDHVSEVR